jgi:antagonist of KipI
MTDVVAAVAAVLKVVAVAGRLSVVDGGPRAWAGVHDGCLAADDRALTLLNAVVGNAWWRAGLELLPGPCTLLACRNVTVAVGGGAGRVTVDGVDVTSWHPLHLTQGQLVRLGPCTAGLVRVVAIAGGCATPAGSRLAGGGSVDGTAGSDAAGGAAVGAAVGADAVARAPDSEDQDAHLQHLSVLRVVPGHERDRCGDEVWSALLQHAFTVSPLSSRQGLRLESTTPLPMSATRRADATSMATVPVWPGAVQLLPSGQPLVLGPDSITTGGYPRLAHVIAVDRYRLAQLRPGTNVSFEAVALDEARHWHAQFEARFRPC